jgi:hypothetical protein
MIPQEDVDQENYGELKKLSRFGPILEVAILGCL